VDLIVDVDRDEFILYFKIGDKRILIPDEMYEHFGDTVREEIEERSC
jgi:hypothetical protein